MGRRSLFLSLREHSDEAISLFYSLLKLLHIRVHNNVEVEYYSFVLKQKNQKFKTGKLPLKMNPVL